MSTVYFVRYYDLFCFTLVHEKTNILQTVFYFLKKFMVVQNFSKALRIGFISFNLCRLDKGC